jgi:predicted naringenin-chalcone synthase
VLFAVCVSRVLRRQCNNACQGNIALAASHELLCCFSAGGRAVIDGMQKHLALSDKSIEPSRAGLYRWGNVSSASVW